MRLAEISRLNGVDLYGLEVRGKTIHDNVSFYLDVMENPSLIHKYAKFNVNSGGNISHKEQEKIWGMYRSFPQNVFLNQELLYDDFTVVGSKDVLDAYLGFGRTKPNEEF